MIEFNSSHKNNNFDALRLLAAFFVFYSHSFALYGLHEPHLFSKSVGQFGVTLGEFGVTIFFVISGYLITASLERSDSYWHFFLRRCARLYPGYWMNLVVLIFCIGPLVTAVPVWGYFHFLYHHWQTMAYRFIYFDSPPLPYVFSNNPVSGLVNGPTWTLPWEAGCYIAIALLYLFRCMQNNRFIYILLILLIINVYWEPETVEDVGKIHCGSFALGAFYYLYRKKIFFTIPYLAMAGLAFAALVHFDIYCVPAYQLLSAYIILSLAMINNRCAFVGKYGDFSYGFYLYAWPIQQMAASYYRFNPAHFVTYFAVSLMGTLVAAIISWHVIEQPFLIKAKQLR